MLQMVGNGSKEKVRVIQRNFLETKAISGENIAIVILDLDMLFGKKRKERETKETKE